MEAVAAQQFFSIDIVFQHENKTIRFAWPCAHSQVCLTHGPHCPLELRRAWTCNPSSTRATLGIDPVPTCISTSHAALYRLSRLLGHILMVAAQALVSRYWSAVPRLSAAPHRMASGSKRHVAALVISALLPSVQARAWRMNRCTRCMSTSASARVWLLPALMCPGWLLVLLCPGWWLRARQFLRSKRHQCTANQADSCAPCAMPFTASSNRARPISEASSGVCRRLLPMKSSSGARGGFGVSVGGRAWYKCDVSSRSDHRLP